METSTTLLQKPTNSNTAVSLTVENKQMKIWKVDYKKNNHED
jgi:hypothetical protein